MRKTLIVGLDGATFDLIRPWVADGLLPTFARLMREGAHGELRSVLPPLTAPAWATMVTGTNPGQHGLVDFWARDFHSYGFRLLNASARARPALWDLVGQHDGKVVVCNVPMTYPPTPVNGVMVSGLDTPGLDSEYTYPASLKQELDQAAGAYRIVGDDWRFGRTRQYDRAQRAPFDDLEARFAAASYLLGRYPWDLAMVVFTATDGTSHFFWHLLDETHPLYDPEAAAVYGDTLLRVYQALDGKLAALLDMLPTEGVLVVVSDHGNGPISDRAIYLNAWLEQQGLLIYRRGSRWERARRALLGSIVHSLRNIAVRMYDRLPHHTRVRLEAMMPGGGKRIDSLLTSAQIDWSKTRAFSEEVRGSIWINLAGRDPQGIVQPGPEYKALCQQIIEGVMGLRDPRTGDPLIQRAYRREELYHGPYAHLRPDITLEANDTLQIFRRTDAATPAAAVRILSRQELAQGHTSGQHLMNGILLMRGAGIREGSALQGLEMQDVAPTVLYAMDLPVPRWMDGKVALQAFAPSYVAAHAPAYSEDNEGEGPAATPAQTRYSEEETEIIEERLRGLGYL